MAKAIGVEASKLESQELIKQEMSSHLNNKIEETNNVSYKYQNPVIDDHRTNEDPIKTDNYTNTEQKIVWITISWESTDYDCGAVEIITLRKNVKLIKFEMFIMR